MIPVPTPSEYAALPYRQRLALVKRVRSLMQAWAATEAADYPP